MKTVCCSNMPFAREAFGTLGDAMSMDGRKISARDVRDADILAIRSTTKVDAALLRESRVRFVGTATIGTDHMDIAYLEKAGIRWCAAPGCNANSVSEYLAAGLLCLAGRHGFTLEGKTIGVIGVGNVGRLVVKKAEALGLQVLQNDPPRQRAESREGAPSPFAPLDEVLARADILTFHVPWTDQGPDATHHVADRRFFSALKPGCVFINAARGAVVHTDALLAAMKDGIVSHSIIDTWEGEPRFRADALDRTDIGTPHIAGHSFEGKVMGTVMVYRKACEFLGVPPTWTADALLPPPLVPRLEIEAAGRDDEAVLRQMVGKIYDIEADDRRLRDVCRKAAGRDAERAEGFDRLRKEYPMRREFRYTQVALKGASPKLRRKVSDLGFAAASPE